MTDVSVIVLAAGAGTRLGAASPKQFLDVAGRRLLDYSLDTLAPWADQTLVTLPAGIDRAQLDLPEGVEAVDGADTRAGSVRAALSHVRHTRVLVHDAARPFVTREIAQAVLDSLDTADCAYPVLPVASSIVHDDHGTLAATPAREELREVQTPQGFRTDVLKRVLEHHAPHPHLPEDVRAMGGTVTHVDGSPWLFKVTYAPSLHAAEYYATHGWGPTT